MTITVKKEIVRIKSLLERKKNYLSFINDVPDFYLNTQIKGSKELLESYSKLIEDDSLYLGQIPIKKTLLSRKTTIPFRINNDDRTNLLYVTGTIGSGAEELLYSIVFEALIKKENVFYFDFYDSCSSLAKISSFLTALGLHSKLIVLSEEDLKILSKEKIKYYVKKNKIVLILTKAQEKTALDKVDKQINKAIMLIKTVGEMEKERKCNIYINDSNALVSGKSEASIRFMDLINSGDLEKYKKTKLILKGYICTFIYNKDKNENFFKNCKDLILMKNEGELPSELLDFNEILPDVFRRIVKSQGPGDFIFVKNHQINVDIPRIKGFFSNIRFIENISIDNNE